MIDRIFWDIDETLIHTSPNPFDDDCSAPVFTVPYMGQPSTSHLKIRPEALEVIDFSRSLVGKDNVFILTTAIREYARAVNEIAKWGFANENIFSREDLHEYRYSTAYGGSTTIENRTIASQNNVLIDNLPQRENINKMLFIGIQKDRYFKVEDYYGVDFPNDSFANDVISFLTNLHNDIVPLAEN